MRRGTDGAEARFWIDGWGGAALSVAIPVAVVVLVVGILSGPLLAQDHAGPPIGRDRAWQAAVDYLEASSAPRDKALMSLLKGVDLHRLPPNSGVLASVSQGMGEYEVRIEVPPVESVTLFVNSRGEVSPYSSAGQAVCPAEFFLLLVVGLAVGLSGGLGWGGGWGGIDGHGMRSPNPDPRLWTRPRSFSRTRR